MEYQPLIRDQLNHDLTDITSKVLFVVLRKHLDAAIARYNELCKLNSTLAVTPPHDLVFAAFRLCPLELVEIVVCGQDPYPAIGVCNGLSFAVARGQKVPPSLLAIYKCLHKCKLISTMPDHGDLTSWAQQRVLLINTELTTFVGVSAGHKGVWSKYTDAIMSSIGSATARRKIFILLGAHAQKKHTLIDHKHSVLVWGHPSPLSKVNQDWDNPRAFIHCDVFTKANDDLASHGKPIINWDSVNTPIVTLPTPTPVYLADVPTCDRILYVFTDGGAAANGSPACTATWGVYCVVARGISHDAAIVVEPPDDQPIELEMYGKVDETTLSRYGGDSTVNPSNNRGEWTAILVATTSIIEGIKRGENIFACNTVMVLSDSELCVKTLNIWYKQWSLNPTIKAKKANLDLIDVAYQRYTELQTLRRVTIAHMRGHNKDMTICKFYRDGNERADHLCAK